MGKPNNDLLAAARDAVGGLQATFGAAKKELDALQADRDEIARAPTARSDIKAAISVWVDEQAADYRAKLDPIFDVLSALPGEIDAALRPEGGREHLTRLFGQARFSLNHEAAAVGALVLSVGPDAAKAALHRELERALPAEGGMPKAQRDAELARLDAEIRDRTTALDQMRRDSTQIGLVLQ
jgi:hypothetical protein